MGTLAKPFDASIANMSDEDLELIIELRKKIKGDTERKGYIKGLYYIANIDDDYSDIEKEIVEGTACALGFDEEKQKEIIRYVEMDSDPLKSIAFSGDKNYRELLFEEMGALTYIKGYQLSAEDDALKKAAAVMGISDGDAEKILMDLYLKSQGVQEAMSTTAKILLGAGGVAAGALICGLTAGAAAPAIGATIGSGMGLSGAAATSAGLAALGGGTIAAGGGGVAMGTTVIAAAGAILGGGASALTLSVADNIANAHDQKKLKEVIKKQQKDNMTKQEITDNLIEAINVLKKRLKILEEKNASKRDIATVQLQLANMQAQKAALELEG